MLTDWPFDPFLLGAWMSIVLVFSIYNVLQGRLLREPWRVTLGFLALTIAVSEAYFYGLFSFPSPEWQALLAPYVASVSIVLITVQASRFTRSFLEFDRLIPDLDRTLGTMEKLVMLPVLALPFVPPPWVAIAQLSVASVHAVYWTRAFAQAFRLGGYGARLMALGWLFVAVGGIGWYARNLGVFDNGDVSTILTVGFIIGVGVEGVLVSLALSYRLQKLAADRLEALSDARRANEVARALQARLETDIAERTRELHRQERRADEEHRSKQAFLSLISHDLRGPLNSVSQALDGLVDAYREARLSSFEPLLARVSETLGEQVALVDRLLDIESLRVGLAQGASPPGLDLHASVERRFASWRQRFSERGLTLVNRIGEETILQVDPLLFDTVMDNLLANALKHGLFGTGVWVEEPSSGYGGVVVGNRYEHLSDEARSRILDQDQSLSTPVSTETPPDAETDRLATVAVSDALGSGRGLGLRLAREVMRSHGGDLIGRIVGDTVLFELRVPAVQRRVLLVDDQPLQIRMLSERLLALRPDLTLIEADGVSSALQQLGEQSVDLILCDVRMPGRDGFDLLAQVRASVAWEAIPLFLISATETAAEARGLQQRSAREGADGFFTKPLTREDLEGLLEHAAL